MPDNSVVGVEVEELRRRLFALTKIACEMNSAVVVSSLRPHYRKLIEQHGDATAPVWTGDDPLFTRAEAVDFFVSIYPDELFGIGHVVLEDNNLSDESIKNCIDWARRHKHLTPLNNFVMEFLDWLLYNTEEPYDD